MCLDYSFLEVTDLLYGNLSFRVMGFEIIW